MIIGVYIGVIGKLASKYNAINVMGLILSALLIFDLSTSKLPEMGFINSTIQKKDKCF